MQALMGALKNSGSPKKIQQAINDPDSYPVPSLAFLAAQSNSTAAQPNVLCFDDNMFTRCGCNYEHPPNATIKDEKITKYFNAGLQFPIEALFSAAHSSKAYIGVCEGLLSAAAATTAPAQVHTLLVCCYTNTGNTKLLVHVDLVQQAAQSRAPTACYCCDTHLMFTHVTLCCMFTTTTLSLLSRSVSTYK
jgi:hypothetical protein